MALSAQIISLIRDEIGNDADFSDNSPHNATTQLDSLEAVYTDTLRGNSSTLVTALICWRRRLFSLQSRAHDFASGGKLLHRNQRIRFMERRIKDLELLADETLRASNVSTITPLAADAAAAGAEFS